MDIAVLGGGHGSHAAVIELVEKGHRVRWWQRRTEAATGVQRLGKLVVTDARGTREVRLPEICGDVRQAVTGAELVVLPLPATSHAALAQSLRGILDRDQVVLLCPGSFGSMVFARELGSAGVRELPTLAETGTLPYLVRRHDAGRVVISAYATRLPTGVFPLSRTGHALRILQGAYPAIEPAGDALSGALMNAGPIIHPPLILMNAGPLEHLPAWDIHNEGTQPSIRRVTDALDAERIAIREALGYGAPHFPLADHYREDGDEWMYGRRAHRQLVKSGDWREKIDLHTHRYMVEDTLLGLPLLTSLGRWLDVPTPVASGLLALAVAITGRSADAGGRTLAALGFAGWSVPALQQLLREGYRAAP
jgi:opine dehydrogenase